VGFRNEKLGFVKRTAPGTAEEEEEEEEEEYAAAAAAAAAAASSYRSPS
jgi:hypothetical protein